MDGSDVRSLSPVKLLDTARSLLDDARTATPSVSTDAEHQRLVHVRRWSRRDRGTSDMGRLDVAASTKRSRRGNYLLLLTLALGGVGFVLFSRRRARIKPSEIEATQDTDEAITALEVDVIAVEASPT